MDKDLLLKQASDLISDLVEDISTSKSTIQKLEEELSVLKKATETEKLANELELKGLVSFDKISALRDGNLDEDEINELKTLSKLDLSYNSNYESSTKVATGDFDSQDSAVDYNRRLRTQFLMDNL
jgi:hypothetical protein